MAIAVDEDYINILGRRLDRRYDQTNTATLDGLPPTNERYHTFQLSSSPDRPHQSILLGQGALFGPVIEAVLQDGTPVAVKTYVQTKDEFTHELLTQSAAHEYRRGQQDLGPRFVRARALFETMDQDQGPVFLLLMDLVEGVSLLRLPNGEIDHSTQIAWTRDALEALVSMVNHHLIQQDIKPGNIMATNKGLVFIDHGSVRAELAASVPNLQSTAVYQAPEFNTTNEFTIETMTFSMGLTLLEIFTEGEPYLEPEYNLKTASLTGPRRINRRTRHGQLNLDDPRLDPRVQSLIASMTERDPARRGKPHDLYAAIADDRTLPTMEIPVQRASNAETSRTQEPDVTPELGEPKTLHFEPVNPPAANAQPDELMVGTPLEQPKFVDVESFPIVPLRNGTAPRDRMIDFAGVDSTHVQIGSERRNYRFIGIALMVYAVYIFFGVMSVGHQMTGDWRVGFIGAVTVGLLLGRALVNFDRSIVNTVTPNFKNLDAGEPDKNPIHYGLRFWLTILIRVLTTILVAFLIGESVAVEIFHRDIAAKTSEYVQADLKNLNKTIQDKYGTLPPKCNLKNPDKCPKGTGQRGSLAAAIAAARQREEDARKLPGQLRQQAEDERKGKGPTGDKNCGPRCNELLDAADEAQKTYDDKKIDLIEDITDAETAASKLEDKINDEFKAQRQDIEDASGPLTQSRALFDLMRTDRMLRIKSISLIAVFMTVELFAVLMKIGMSGNSYERSQARRARIVEFGDIQQTGVDRQHIRDAADANKELQTYVISLNAALKTNYLEEHAARLPHRDPPASASGPELAPTVAFAPPPTVPLRNPPPPGLARTLPHVSKWPPTSMNPN